MYISVDNSKNGGRTGKLKETKSSPEHILTKRTQNKIIDTLTRFRKIHRIRTFLPCI